MSNPAMIGLWVDSLKIKINLSAQLNCSVLTALCSPTTVAPPGTSSANSEEPLPDSLSDQVSVIQQKKRKSLKETIR